MPRERRAFRPSDVTAAIKAVKRAGESVARVEVDPDGKVMVFTGSPEAPDQNPAFDQERALERFENALRTKKQARPRKGAAS
jgi:hypothetical protein